MKSKPNSNGFTSSLLVLVAAIIVFVGFAAWFVIRHNSRNNSQSSSTNYTAGAVRVTFKDGTVSSQAIKLVKSYGLTLQQSPADLKKIFTPSVTTGVRHDHGTAITDEIKQNLAVTGITDDHQDNANDIHFFNINFKEGTTAAEINQILTNIHSIDAESGTNYQSNLWVVVEVPPGQENTYINKFEQNSSVQTAILYRPAILQ